MPRDQKKKHEASRAVGGTKSSRWSSTTRANKARKAETRANRLQRAAERKLSEVWINPTTGRKAVGGTRTGKINNRAISAAKVFSKREQRRLFARLTPQDKDKHRRAGREHVKLVG